MYFNPKQAFLLTFSLGTYIDTFTQRKYKK